MLDPELKELVDKSKAALEQGATLKTQIDEMLAWGAENGRLADMEKAITQLEADQKSILDNVESRVAQVRRQAYDDRGSYRGVFANEDQARAWGLFVMAETAGADVNRRDFYRDALKSAYPDVYEKAMASDPASSGGALIPPEFSTRLQHLIEQYGVFESAAFIMPMQSESLSFLKQTGEPSVFLVGENTSGTSSDPSFANIVLAAKEWGTLTFYPKTLDEDSAVGVGQIVAESIAWAFAYKTDLIGFNGDGTSTSFGILGVRSRLAAVNGVDDGGGLVLGSGNAWSELTLPDHDKLMGILPQYAAGQGRAAWYASRAYFFNVMVRLMHAAGGLTAGEIEGRRQLLFNGDPVRISQVFPAAEANSQIPVIYGDLRAAATVGRRRGMTIEQDASYKFAERQITVLGTQRKAINVHDVGTATVAGPVVGLITASS